MRILCKFNWLMEPLDRSTHRVRQYREYTLCTCNNSESHNDAADTRAREIREMINVLVSLPTVRKSVKIAIDNVLRYPSISPRSLVIPIMVVYVIIGYDLHLFPYRDIARARVAEVNATIRWTRTVPNNCRWNKFHRVAYHMERYIY